MNLKKTLLSVLMILQLCLLVGCDYIEKASKVDDLVTQQELQKSKIEALEKQQTTIINSTKTLAGVVKAVKNKQDEFVFTEFNPAQTQYFILNNGSVGLAGKYCLLTQ